MSHVPRSLLVATLVAGLLGLLAFAGTLWFLSSGAGVGQRFSPGPSVAVDLSPEKPVIIWGPVDGPRAFCDLSRPAGRTDFARIEGVVFDDVFTEAEGRRWRGHLLLSASPPGRYDLTCAGDPQTELAFGTPPRLVESAALPRGLQAPLRGAALVSGLVAALGAAGLLAGRRRTPA